MTYYKRIGLLILCSALGLLLSLLPLLCQDMAAF
jgi:hypothetical protein